MSECGRSSPCNATQHREPQNPSTGEGIRKEIALGLVPFPSWPRVDSDIHPPSEGHRSWGEGTCPNACGVLFSARPAAQGCPRCVPRENLDPRIREFIDGRADSIYRSWKSRCRTIYTLYGRRWMPEEFKQRLSESEWLIENEFENEAKKALCARNKANRTKNPNPINHRSGPKPLSHRAIELAKEGSQAPFVEAVVNMYKSYPNAEERVEKLKRSL